MTLPQLRRIRWAVRAVLLLGVAASVVGNVLHAWDNPISQAIAAWPPLALLLTVELISRVPVHRRSLAFARLAATAVIAGIAAWVSYWHMAAVAAKYGETDASPYLLPLSVDGLVVVASICLVELAGRIRDASTPAPVTPPEEPGQAEEEPAPDPWDYAEPIGPQPTPEPAADVTKPVRRSRPKALTSEQKVKRAAAKLPGGTPAQIAAKAGVSESTARRYLPAPSPAAEDAAPEMFASPGVDATGRPVVEVFAGGGGAAGVVIVPSPSGPDAAETATEPAVSGQPVDLVEATR
ncbi:DUF2637 domain-containing protein [Micromonosporaceae bacterium B7E4]